MTLVHFYPIDIDYITGTSGAAVIRIFGKTPDGKRICVYDDTFQPYFYVLPKKKEAIGRLIDQLLTIKVKERDRIAFVTKEELKMFTDILDYFETDIPFSRRYLIDNKITPLISCTVEGKEIEDSIQADITIKAARITQQE